MELFRDQRIVTVGTADTVIAPGNKNRHALMIDCPPMQSVFGTSIVASGHNVDCSAVAYVTGTGGIGTGNPIDIWATATLTAGAAPTLSLTASMGGNVVKLVTGQPPINFHTRITLDNASTIFWHVDTGGAAATCDLTITAQLPIDESVVTLSFNGRAIANQGIKLYAGGSPVILIADVFGPAIREEVHAIGSIAGITLCVVDIFCPCGGVADKKMRGGYR